MRKQSTSAVWYYFFGILALCISFAMGCNSIAGVNDDVTTGFAQVPSPGKQEIMLASRGTYYIFGMATREYGQKVNMSAGNIAEMQMTLCSMATGAQVVLSSVTTPVEGLTIQPIRVFIIDTPGAYLFTAFYPANRLGPGGMFAIGQNPMVHALGDIAASIAAALGVLVAGIFFLVVGYRTSHRYT
jgi:hypothetical protein